jgi:hypothetical protein
VATPSLKQPVSRIIVLDFYLGDFDAELGFDLRWRLIGLHQPPLRQHFAHMRKTRPGLFASSVPDMEQVKAALGGECDAQGMGERRQAGLGKIRRMGDGLDQISRAHCGGRPPSVSAGAGILIAGCEELTSRLRRVAGTKTKQPTVFISKTRSCDIGVKPKLVVGFGRG